MSETTTAPAVNAAPVPSYVVTQAGYGFAVGSVLNSIQVEAAKKAGTLGVFTVRTMKGA